MEEQRPRRYFVTIMVPDERRRREVVGLGFDLFAGRSAESGYQIDGLITLEDVGRLVEAGCRVLVGDTDRPKRTPELVGFAEWRADVVAELEQAHAAAQRRGLDEPPPVAPPRGAAPRRRARRPRAAGQRPEEA